MSDNLPALVLRWFATHLVLFTLVGFALAALPVFGWVDPPFGWTWAAVQAPAPGSAAAVRGSGPAGAAPAATVPMYSTPAPVATPARPPRSVQTPPTGGFSAERSAAAPDRARPALPAPAAQGFRPSPMLPLPEQKAPTREDMVQDARRAFWNGDFEAAEAAYMEVLGIFPADADLFGELGNLYRAMGRADKARDAYYEAAVRLKSAGDKEKLALIADLLDAEDDARAVELRP